MPDPIRQQLMAEQIGKIAELLGVNIEDIRFDSNWISLDLNQVAQLTEALDTRGYQKAINTLSLSAYHANSGEDSERNLTQWAVLTAAASFLEGQAGLPITQMQTCTCRCQQAKNCGGCGHAGCDYSKED